MAFLILCFIHMTQSYKSKLCYSCLKAASLVFGRLHFFKRDLSSAIDGKRLVPTFGSG